MNKRKIQCLRPSTLISCSWGDYRGVQLAWWSHCICLANACLVAEAQDKALEKTVRGVLGASLTPFTSSTDLAWSCCKVTPVPIVCVWKKSCASALIYSSNDEEFVYAKWVKKNVNNQPTNSFVVWKGRETFLINAIKLMPAHPFLNH